MRKAGGAGGGSSGPGVPTLAALLLGIVVGVVGTYSLRLLRSTETPAATSSVSIPMQAFPEPPWRPPGLIEARTIASTPFARFEVHRVRTESGVVVDDWLWTDERTHVNILVHLRDRDRYLLLHQTKYGLQGRKYAVVGGLFNEGETDPVACAHRELLEEVGLVAERMVPTGAYRVQVNRGGGILHTFLALNCSQAPKASLPADFENDYESLEQRLLTTEELLRVALTGEVGEVQWVAAVALGLLHREHAHRLGLA